MKSEAIIYLSESRGSTWSASHQSFHTFNFGNYFQEHRGPFKDLIAVNDEVLLPVASLNYESPDNCVVWLLPVAGAIEIKCDEAHVAEAGQGILLSIQKGSVLTLSNPYQHEPVGFIACWFSAGEVGVMQALASSFDLDASKNFLVSVFTFRNFRFHIGKFSGRTDTALQLQSTDGAVFVFIIEGAFEVQGRLLQQRDGLSIASVSTLDFEALSNDAILFIIEW